MSRDSVANILRVSILLCLVCAIAVSVTAVGLQSRQEENKRLDQQTNILLTTGNYKEEELNAEKVKQEFDKNVEVEFIDVETGKVIPKSALPGGESYNARAASADPKQQVKIPGDLNIAKIGVRAPYYPVYKVKKDGQLDSYIFPIVGKGLWSTMYGFIALNPDLKTIRGINYYEHGETPGLGGEVTNPLWKQQWEGKVAFEDGEPAIRVVKTGAKNEHQIDGLAGATITSRGVENTVNYWLGENGFGKYIEQRRQTNQAALPKPVH